ncbi:Hypothetical protein PENO1_079910 [Penicillium occitanis (nom. inval.)]|nr:Hypothetical protein PENO1_079910 [Penicillium occitanis (nom. inval.)]
MGVADMCCGADDVSNLRQQEKLGTRPIDDISQPYAVRLAEVSQIRKSLSDLRKDYCRKILLEKGVRDCGFEHILVEPEEYLGNTTWSLLWAGSTVWGLFDETDKDPFDQVHPILRAHRKKRHKRWSWNFTELKSDANSNLIHGRVDSRSPPGMDNWRECTAWIHFTVTFVHTAIPTKATMNRLREFESDWSEYF